MKGLLLVIPVLFLLYQTAFSQADDPVFLWIEHEETGKLDQYLKDHYINSRYGEQEMTLLVHSILHSKSTVTEYLLDQGADANMDIGGVSPLMHAAGMSDVKKISLLINAGATLETEDTYGNTAIFYAAANGNMKIIERLVKLGAIVSHKNKNKQTAYDMAIINSHQEIAKYLRIEYEKNLPDMSDGPYIRWTGKRKIKAFYMVHDSKSGLTKKKQSPHTK
ncbi:ankyrin repeat domain-containing protein [Bacteroidota bacterium]